MRRLEARRGVWTIKILDVSGRYEAAEFDRLAAAELLGVGERTFRRRRVDEDGEAGLLDRRLGKLSASSFLATEAEGEALHRTSCSGFAAKHFLVGEDGRAATFRASNEVFGRHGHLRALLTPATGEQKQERRT